MNVQHVSVLASQINNNNLSGAASPYFLREADGSVVRDDRDPLKPKVQDKTIPTCHICFEEFQKFSQLAIHNGCLSLPHSFPPVTVLIYLTIFNIAKPCNSESAEEIDPIRICFSADQLKIVEQFLTKVKKTPQENRTPEEPYVYITVSRLQTKLFLQRLYFAEVALFNLENWYSEIRAQEKSSEAPLTAPSWFVPLSDSDLKLLQRLLSARLLGGDASGLSREDNSTLTSLEQRIDAAMKLGGKSHYFARLSTRSPKDGIPKTADASSEAAEKLKQRQQSLRVSSPVEIVALLSRSQRVFGDIANFFQYRDSFRPAASLGQTLPALNLILREWIDDLEPAREFRCYVYKGKMTAISQYYCYDKFEEYSKANSAMLEQIRAAILNFHAKVSSTFSSVIAPSYVFDVIVSRDLSKVQVVELNPFGAHMSSGAALFNWITDRDLLYGKNGQEPPIRVLEELLPEPKS